MGEKFLYFWQHHLCRWPAPLMLTSARGAVGDRAISQSSHIWAEWELVTLPGFCFLPAMPLAGVTRLRHFPTLAYRSWAKQGWKSCAQKAHCVGCEDCHTVGALHTELIVGYYCLSSHTSLQATSSSWASFPSWYCVFRKCK